MKVTVKYFASIREAIGVPSEVVNTEASTLKALRDELIARGGAHAQALARGKSVRVSLNQLMSEEAADLPSDGEVAFFPPVTGG